MSLCSTILVCAVLLAVLPVAQGADPAPAKPALPEYQTRAGLPGTVAKLKAGASVTIAYLGGSITEANGWRDQSREWLQKRYPAARIVGINAAVPGTGSDLGVFRLEHDVLPSKPDLVFVEFAVNDSGAAPERVRAAMEGIVRKVRHANPKTDLCFVYTLSAAQTAGYRAGELPSTVRVMEEVAAHYGIPSITFGVSVSRMEGEGKLVFTGPQPTDEAGRAALAGKILFSGDGIHPYTETGHPLYRDAIARAFPGIEAASSTPKSYALPAPLVSDHWSNARMQAPDAPGTQRSGSWKQINPADDPRFRTYTRALPQLWAADGKAGASLTVPFTGTVFGLMGMKGPDAGAFSVSIDGAPPVVSTLFDRFSLPGRWRIRPYWYPKQLKPGPHVAVVTVLPESPDKATLLGQPLAATGDPHAFDDLILYLSGILIVPEE